MADRLLHLWSELGVEIQATYIGCALMGGMMIMVFGWVQAEDLTRREKQVMALATLLLPLTCALAPFVWGALAIWKLCQLVTWLISTAAGEDPNGR